MGVACVFSIFNAGGSVCECVCVYTHTHTHTAQMGYLDVSPGVGMRHLDGPKNPDGLNLGIRIHTHTPSYTSTRVENKEDTVNTPIFPSVKT